MRVFFILFLIALYKAAFCRDTAIVCEAKLRLCVETYLCSELCAIF